MTTERFIPDTANVGNLFGLNSPPLVVPPYQRRFAWIYSQEVSQLWEDLVEACEGPLGEYFLGTVVLCRSNNGQNTLEVIDGQQRLATLTMILAAIRNRLMQLGEGNGSASEAAHRVGDFIARRGFMGDPRGFAFSVGEYDKQSFERYVQLRPGDEQHLDVSVSLPRNSRERPPINKIREAFRLLLQLVEGYGQPDGSTISNDEEITKLSNLAEYITGNVILITITVQDDVDAFDLFETMNFRGLDLSTADLLKNRLYMLPNASSTQSDTLSNIGHLWTEFVGILENQSITRFLRYHWMSHYSTVTEKNLYRTIRNWIDEKGISPERFLEELNESARLFVDLVSPSDGTSNALDLKDLAAMRVTQGLPFLMSAKDELDDKEFATAIRIVEALSVRNTIVGKRNPNRLERNFGNWARILRESADIESILKEAREELITGEEFARGFEQLSELSTAQARYLLRKIEWSGNVETQMVSSGVEVEHILPQSPNDSWKEHMGGTDEDISEARYRLGNLTLMNERLNKTAAARPFSEKKKQYEQSKIGITRSLVDYEQWSYQAIESRQRDFAERAKSIWSL